MTTRTNIMEALAGTSHHPEVYDRTHTVRDPTCVCQPCWYERDHIRDLEMEKAQLTHERTLEKDALAHTRALERAALTPALAAVVGSALASAGWLRWPLVAWAGVAALHVVAGLFTGGAP